MKRTTKRNVDRLYKEATALTNDFSATFEQANLRLKNAFESHDAHIFGLTPYINNTWGVFFTLRHSKIGSICEQFVEVTATEWVMSIESVVERVMNIAECTINKIRTENQKQDELTIGFSIAPNIKNDFDRVKKLTRNEDSTIVSDAEKLLRRMRQTIFDFEAAADQAIEGQSLSLLDEYHLLFPSTCKAIIAFMSKIEPGA